MIMYNLMRYRWTLLGLAVTPVVLGISAYHDARRLARKGLEPRWERQPIGAPKECFQE